MGATKQTTPIILEYRGTQFLNRYRLTEETKKIAELPELMSLTRPIKTSIQCKYVLSRCGGEMGVITGLRPTRYPNFYEGNVLHLTPKSKKRSFVLFRWMGENSLNLTVLFFRNRNPRNKKRFIVEQVSSYLNSNK